MGAKGEQTREHIMATAEGIILQRGYSGTSIEEIITEAGITKGGFFYHFDGKNDLAKNLILRYLKNDVTFFSGLADRARSLTEDPLQQLLIFLKLMAEAMQDLPDAHPGCLVASFTYEAEQFDDEIRELNAEGVLSWRSMFLEHFERVVEKYPMKIEKPLEELADMLSSVIEGGIIMSKVLKDRNVLPNQILQFRNYVRLVFGDV
ncbi:MAG: TetR/AcrR family transcriptional regulator [Gammaproteobacteria bacterium]|nr:TetR/AcrR family transcriptional regulator [Gammaproteobacteria bacterium]